MSWGVELVDLVIFELNKEEWGIKLAEFKINRAETSKQIKHADGTHTQKQSENIYQVFVCVLEKRERERETGIYLGTLTWRRG
jgi:hypothetical protein